MFFIKDLADTTTGVVQKAATNLAQRYHESATG
jgi:hypothetical protein